MLKGAFGTEKLTLLIDQSRYAEATKLAKEFISQYPEESIYKYFLAFSLKHEGKLDEADRIADILLGAVPDETVYVQLKADIDIDQERLVDAEEKLKGILGEGRIEDYTYLLLGKIKFRQNNYDKSLEYLDYALEIDPENLDALNMRSAVASLIGDSEAELNVDEALNLDPNNAYSIANHATQLLNQGKVDESLERFKEALQIEPENPLAIYGLKEAMKSKFLPYRWLYKFSLYMAKLSSKGNWTVILGAYFIYRFIIRLSKNYPELQPFLIPVIALIFIAFLSTWILEPLMNFTLLGNDYGKLLLDADEKISAKLSGGLFILAFVSCLLWMFVDEKFMMVALAFLLMMLPAGTFLSIKGKDEDKSWYLGVGLMCLGFLSILLILLVNDMKAFMLFALGIFIYQFVVNNWMIKMHGRTFGD